MFKTTKAIAVAAAALLTAPSLAVASTMSLTNTADDLYGVPSLSHTFSKREADGSITRFTMGAMFVTNGEGENMVAFSTDFRSTLDTSAEFSEIASPFSRATTNRMSRMMTGHFGEIDTATEAAAFQLAIWELADDRKFNTGDLVFGRRSQKRRDVRAQAREYLTRLSRFDPEYNLIHLDATGVQNLVAYQLPEPQAPKSLSAVPLPASGLLLLAGIGGLALRGRKSS